VLLGLLASVAIAGCGGSSLLDGSSHGRRPVRAKPTIQYGSFHSNAVRGTLHYAIALPPGYSSSRKRYPVVYVLHGLPAGAQAYRGISGYAESLAATKHPAIVVGAQGARARDTDPEWHDWGPGRNWETATQQELVAFVDGHYRTLAARSARAIVGISAGGYGATLIALHHPETFKVIESWSGYFHLTTPEGRTLDLGSDAAIEDAIAHASVPQIEHRFRPYGRTFFGFYIGNQDPYPGFDADNVRLSDELKTAGIPHTFRIYRGAHNSTFWDQHQDEWLSGAVTHLDRPR
jgi:enterochelin esterase-like enzyme